MSHRSKALKTKVAQGAVTLGAWVTFSEIEVIEIMVGAGFDWLMLDCEHGSIDPARLSAALIAFNGSPTVPIVRVPSLDHALIGRALDAGADGVVVPMIEDAVGARRAVSASKYPPDGSRGYGPRRASGYYRGIDDYVDGANDELLVFLQLESLAAAANVDEIVDVGGIDAIFPGIMDLSGSAGVLRDARHPHVVAAYDTIALGAHRRGIPLCASAWTAAEVRLRVEQGARYLIVAFDDRLLAAASTAAVLEARRHLRALEAGRE